MTDAPWRQHFEQGIQAYRVSKLDSSLTCFTKAIECGANNTNIYDARAAVLEKLGKYDLALKDAKSAIDAGPSRWKGYSRCAHLFFKLASYNKATKMADLALERMKEGDEQRVKDMQDLKSRAVYEKSRESKREPTKPQNRFDTLPFEILCMLFEMVVEDDPSTAFTISHVCNHWRDVAIATSTLWGTLVLSKQSTKQKVIVWRERSKGRIKELIIRRTFTSLSGGACGELSKCSWEHLRTFRTESPRLDLNIFHKLLHRGNEQNLLCLEVKNPDGTRLPLQDRWFRSAAQINLRTLSMQSVSVIWDLLSSKLFSLTSLEARDVNLPYSNVHRFLAGNTNLERISFGSSRLQHGVLPWEPTMVTLANLKHLELNGLNRWAEHFLHDFSFPVIESLSLASIQMPIDDCLTKLKNGGAAGHGSLACLRELNIQRCGVQPAMLLAVLEYTKALEVFQLNHAADVNVIVEALAQTEPESPDGLCRVRPGPQLCRRLKHIDVSHCPDVKTGPILRVVKARNRVEAAAISTSVSAPESAAGAKTEEEPLEKEQKCTELVQDTRVSGTGTTADDQQGYRAAAADASRENGGEDRVGLHALILDGCPLIEVDSLPWLRTKVPIVSCVYLSKKAASYKR